MIPPETVKLLEILIWCSLLKWYHKSLEWCSLFTKRCCRPCWHISSVSMGRKKWQNWDTSRRHVLLHQYTKPRLDLTKSCRRLISIHSESGFEIYFDQYLDLYTFLVDIIYYLTFKCFPYFVIFNMCKSLMQCFTTMTLLAREWYISTQVICIILFWICTDKYGKNKHEWQFVSIVYDLVEGIVTFQCWILPDVSWLEQLQHLSQCQYQSCFHQGKVTNCCLRKAASWQPIVSVAYRSSCRIVSAFMH